MRLTPISSAIRSFTEPMNDAKVPEARTLCANCGAPVTLVDDWWTDADGGSDCPEFPGGTGGGHAVFDRVVKAAKPAPPRAIIVRMISREGGGKVVWEQTIAATPGVTWTEQFLQNVSIDEIYVTVC